MDTSKIPDNQKSDTKLAKPMTWDTVRTRFDPQYVQSEADRELKTITSENREFENTTNVYKAFTLKEFDNGVLLSETLKEEYKTFVIDLSRNIQKEYNCITPSQRATAESIACAYGRILQTSTRISKYLELGTINELGVKYLAVMSKELDRAQRHYTIGLQILYMLKQPPLSITVKAETANIANSQLIQQNHTVKPI